MKVGESLIVAGLDLSKEEVAMGVGLLLDRTEQVQHPGREVMVVIVWMDLIIVEATKVVDREGKEDFADSSIRSNPKII